MSLRWSLLQLGVSLCNAANVKILHKTTKDILKMLSTANLFAVKTFPRLENKPIKNKTFFKYNRIFIVMSLEVI